MVAVGVTERPARSGTLYNTLLYFGSDGRIVGRHRKLMPTYSEHLIWGMGDGTTLRTIETAHGIVGGLICFENYMPLARTTLYAQGEQIHVAPTLAPGHAAWLTAMKHLANEGRMWVISVGNYMRGSDIPRDLAVLGLYEEDEVVNPGGSMIVDPYSEVVAGPVYGEETILYADADLGPTMLRKRMFDVVGHYGRGDLFSLTVAGMPIAIPPDDGSPMERMSDHVWRVPEHKPVQPEHC
jgi:nitrilase